MKFNLSKVLFGIGTLLLIIFLVGLVYIYYDYYAKTIFSYSSAGLSVYIIIHAVIFLVPSILCFIISLLLRSNSKNKA